MAPARSQQIQRLQNFPRNAVQIYRTTATTFKTPAKFPMEKRIPLSPHNAAARCYPPPGPGTAFGPGNALQLPLETMVNCPRPEEQLVVPPCPRPPFDPAGLLRPARAGPWPLAPGRYPRCTHEPCTLGARRTPPAYAHADLTRIAKAKTLIPWVQRLAMTCAQEDQVFAERLLT